MANGNHYEMVLSQANGTKKSHYHKHPNPISLSRHLYIPPLYKYTPPHSPLPTALTASTNPSTVPLNVKALTTTLTNPPLSPGA